MNTGNSNKTLLVAEDEAISRMYLAEILRDKKFKVLEAEDGEEAVELCKKHPEIDLVLMDVKMPVLDGYQAAKQIREFRPDLLMILQTAFVSDKSEKEELKGLFQDIIQKPVNEKHLYMILDRHLS
jgi:CheY-like chemotaxis protein